MDGISIENIVLMEIDTQLGNTGFLRGAAPSVRFSNGNRMGSV